ncbi:hypothetical protein pipiens_001032 [Culex pipiens pipiens]|uniref:Uncharacterized protein n=1 Tax=Culex pipiens pipiens TaxID=38569 RepID=A0ABD1E130_CULPP
MSFFSSLQQYVTSGVAGLGLNPRRFSLHRQESAEATTPAASGSGMVPSPLMMMDPSKMNNTGGILMGPPPPGSGGSIGSGGGGGGGGSPGNYGMGSGGGGAASGATLGYPKVVTPGAGPGSNTMPPGSPGALGPGGQAGSTLGATIGPAQGGAAMRRQSSARGLDTLVPPGRTGSFRGGRNSPINPTAPDKPSFAVWKRRPSWPEVEIKSSSGVQENDGSYFESFTALSWKNENRRMSAVRAVETRAEVLPESETDRLLEDDIERSEQKEHLYLDVLYAIANTVGAPAPGGQFAHYKEEMYLQAQRVFSVSADRHYRLLHAATEEKPKIIVLTVVVQEAEGLEAKDANGK